MASIFVKILLDYQSHQNSVKNECFFFKRALLQHVVCAAVMWLIAQDNFSGCCYSFVIVMSGVRPCGLLWLCVFSVFPKLLFHVNLCAVICFGMLLSPPLLQNGFYVPQNWTVQNVIDKDLDFI